LFTKVNFFVILAAVFIGTSLYEVLYISSNKLATFLGLQDLTFLFKNLLYLMPREFLYNLLTVIFIFAGIKAYRKIFSGRQRRNSWKTL
jgi:predicted membrane protein